MNAAPQTAKEIFVELIGKVPPADWDERLNQACGTDHELRQRVRELLNAHRNPDSFLETPPSAVAVEAGLTIDQLPLERPGTQIGPYKLLQQIGEGGMGVVYMAEQHEPVKRKVALKLIKAGMDSRQVIARFEAERQALAMMDHVNIARVLDAGTTELGRPYFVMELVHGVPITKYCDDNRLTPRQRLELFVPVCQAIQHAHQKGIIHRDIKPSNVMVTLYDGKPVPKVIDFGVAKATEQTLTERTLFTKYGTMVGTLEYMSPEQAEMSALGVDTRSDIYSLGVLLYELLTGSTPLSSKRMKEAAYAEVLRLIKEEEPPKPSTRLSESGEALASISAQRHTEPAKLSKLMRGELDWIVMKTLEKDRGRRYETASGFAADVQRYLDDEPVQACPPSAAYRFRKFARRNRPALVTVAVISAALMLGSVVSTWQAVRATRAETLAESRLKAQTQAHDEADKARENETRQREAADAARNDEAKQRAIAEQRRIEADDQRAEAERLGQVAKEERDRASDAELLARRRFYAAQTNLAQQAWEAGNPSRVLELLESQRPRFDEEDLRTFEWYYLWRLCHSELRFTWRAHKQEIACITFSPDGKTLASASDDATVKLWNVSTGQELSTLKGLYGFRAAVTFSPDGKHLVSAGYMGKGEVWDVTTGRSLPIHFPEHSMERAVAFSPDGKTLAGGNARGEIKLWDVASWQEKLTIKAQSNYVGSLMFSPDGRTLSSTSAWGESKVKVWDLTVEPPKLTRELNGEMSVTFSPDGKTLATGGGQVNVYDVATGKELGKRHSDRGTVYSVAFSPDGKKLAFGTQSRNATLWNPATGVEQTYAHLAPVRSVAFSPDGKVLASVSADGIIKVWELVAKQESTPQGIPSGSRCPLFSPDGSMLALLAPDATIKLYELATGQVTSIPVRLGPEYPSLVFTPDGKTLALSSGEVTLWDVPTGRHVGSLKGSRPFRCFALSPDGKTVATAEAAYLPIVQLWDLNTKQMRVTLQGPPNGFPFALAFSPDGQSVVLGGEHEWVTAWDAATGKKRATLQQGMGGYRSVGCLAFSPDGKLLATGQSHGIVKLWDAATGQLGASLNGHTAAVKSIVFLPDGKTLITGSADRTLKLWDIATAQERLTLKGQSPDWHSVAVSPNGKILATVAEQGIITLRRAATDQPAVAPKTELNPDDPLSPVGQNDAADRLRAAGQLQEAEESHRNALARLEKLAAAFPSEPAYRTEIIRSYFGRTFLFRKDGRSRDADEIYRKGLAAIGEFEAKFPEQLDYRTDNAGRLCSLSLLLSDAGRPQEADAAFRQGKELCQKLPPAYQTEVASRYVKLGRTLAKLDPQEAVQAFGQANELSPNDHSVWFERAYFYRKAIELDPKSARAHNNLGFALETHGKFDEAITSYRRAIDLDPNSHGSHNQLAWILATCPEAELRDSKRAVALAKRAVELKPEAGAYWNTLGAAQYRAGDCKEAVAALEKSDELLKGDHYSFNAFFLAMAHWQLEDKEDARKWYDQAVAWMDKNQPQNEELRRFRAEAEELLGLKEKKE